MLRRVIVSAVFGALLLPGIGFAQGTSGGTPAVDPSTMTNEQKQEAVEAMLTKQRAAVKKAAKELKEATDAKDIVRKDYLQGKLDELTSLLEISEKASIAMTKAIAEGNTDEVNHQFKQVSTSSDSSTKLMTQIQTSLGGSAGGQKSGFSGKTEVKVVVEGGASTTGNPVQAPPLVQSTTTVAPPPPVGSSF